MSDKGSNTRLAEPDLIELISLERGTQPSRILTTMGLSVILSTAILAGASLTSEAQLQYQPPPYQQVPRSLYPPLPGLPYYRASPSSRPAPLSHLPPSWFYNPYTDGTVPDPRARGGP